MEDHITNQPIASAPAPETQSQPMAKRPGRSRGILAVVVIVILLAGVLYWSGGAGLQYTDPQGAYSIQLPRGWEVLDQEMGTTTSITRFAAPHDEEDGPSMTIAVHRFERTPTIEGLMALFTEEGFFQLVANDVKSGLNEYQETSNATTTMRGIEYHVISGTYVAPKSQKVVAQDLYVALLDDAYYLVGTDAYTDLWEENAEAIRRSVASLTFASSSPIQP